nr:unnamed protein product [Callosobruchus analis]
MIVMFRYLHKGGIFERFWCFLSVSDNTIILLKL